MAVPAQAYDVLSTKHLDTDLERRSVRGGVLTLTSQGVQFAIQSVSTVVLARLLDPADFGIVAMVTSVTGLGQAFADLGLSEATIQRDEITHDQVSMLFWINVAIGLGLTLVCATLAPVFSWFYREPRLFNITLLVSLTFLIGGLRVQHDALLKRQMRYRALAVRDVLAWGIAVPTAIVMALRGAEYWAIAALPLVMNFTAMIFSWVLVRWRPGLPKRGTNVRSMVLFGGHVAASYVLITINRNIDNVLIGWRWGAGLLGLYSRAYNLLMLPVRQLSAPAASVAVPTFSRVQDDPERFERYYLRAINLVLWISAPLFGFLFVAARPVIILVLGSKWVEAALVFKILTISALGQLLLESLIWLFISRGQSEKLSTLLLMLSPGIVLGIFIALPFGIEGVAVAVTLVLVFIFPVLMKYSFRGTNLNLRRIGRAILNPLAATIVGVCISELVLRALAPRHVLMQLLVIAVSCVIGYGASLVIPSVRAEVMSFKPLYGHLKTGRA